MKKALCAALSVAALAFALETVARLRGAGELDRAERQMLWLRSDAPVAPLRDGRLVGDPGLAALAHPHLDLSLTPAAGVVRIACVGDSTTAGWPYHPRGSYARWLEAILTDVVVPRTRFEVVNAGFHGFDSTRLTSVARELSRARIDIMIFRAGYDDHYLFPLRAAAGSWRARAADLHWFLLARSRFYAAVSHALVRGAPRISAQLPPRLLSPAEAVALVARYRENLDSFVSTARAAGARPLLLSLPYSTVADPDLPAAARWPELGAQLRETSRRLRVPLADLGPALKPGDYVDDLHVGLEGDEAVAKTAARTICAERLLGPRTSCDWRRLRPRKALLRELKLDDREFLTHVHVGLALMRLFGGERLRAVAELVEAERLAVNRVMVAEELRQLHRDDVLQILAEADRELGLTAPPRAAAAP